MNNETSPKTTQNDQANPNSTQKNNGAAKNPETFTTKIGVSTFNRNAQTISLNVDRSTGQPSKQTITIVS